MEHHAPIPVADSPSAGRTLSLAAAAGAVLAGVLASACCLGPVILAALGLGGAGLLARFDPYRPFFTVATFGLLAAGFYRAYRTPRLPSGEACGCARPGARRLGRAVLWIAAAVAVFSWAFPYVAGALHG